MIDATGCPKSVFNIPISAGLYSQMSGVLAGFTFAAIVLLLTRTRDTAYTEREMTRRGSGNGLDGKRNSESRELVKASDKGTLLAFMAAFFIYVTTMLTYSVLAGEPLPGALGRAAAEELLDAVPLALAAMMLFHGMTLLIEDAHISRSAVGVSRGMAGFAVPVLVMWYLANAAADTEAAYMDAHTPQVTCTGTAPVPAFGLWLTIPLVVILGLLMAVGSSRRLGRLRVFIRRVQAVVPVMCVAISVAVAFLSAFINTRSGGFLMAPWALYLYLAVIFLTFLFVGAVAVLSGEQWLLTSDRGDVSSKLRARRGASSAAPQ